MPQTLVSGCGFVASTTLRSATLGPALFHSFGDFSSCLCGENPPRRSSDASAMSCSAVRTRLEKEITRPRETFNFAIQVINKTIHGCSPFFSTRKATMGYKLTIPALCDSSLGNKLSIPKLKPEEYGNT